MNKYLLSQNDTVTLMNLINDSPRNMKTLFPPPAVHCMIIHNATFNDYLYKLQIFWSTSYSRYWPTVCDPTVTAGS